jgi:integrase/recombinase XerC
MIERSIWSDFLSLKISAHTQRVYAKAVADFFQRVYTEPASPATIAKFLILPQSEAIFQVLNYRRLLIEANLAPSTINVRLSALKSLVDYARRMGECDFNLADVRSIKSETYRDTTGIGVEEFKSAISLPDRTTAIGARDYAILRLLWDNALRRGEVCSLNVEDFIPSGQLKILGKGKIQRKAIDLTEGATVAILSHTTGSGEMRGGFLRKRFLQDRKPPGRCAALYQSESESIRSSVGWKHYLSVGAEVQCISGD